MNSYNLQATQKTNQNELCEMQEGKKTTSNPYKKQHQILYTIMLFDSRTKISISFAYI